MMLALRKQKKEKKRKVKVKRKRRFIDARILYWLKRKERKAKVKKKVKKKRVKMMKKKVLAVQKVMLKRQQGKKEKRSPMKHWTHSKVSSRTNCKIIKRKLMKLKVRWTKGTKTPTSLSRRGIRYKGTDGIRTPKIPLEP